ncbi:DUF1871 family protein [Paenisporosarcina sp. TG20]|uniref:DUF1871 family protein n=1 Tax=Paenisporosarcina sp. TG20 TaxID=1211706 RepID=UPI0002F3BA4B|nr:DUF1871 family protein [Paenisporosarcina sp. TG20]
MENIEMNRKAVKILQLWDPFNLGSEAYDTEAADVVADLQGIDHPTELAKRIQVVYEHSFEQWIPIEKCVQIAYKLIAVKFESNCIV